MAKQNLQAEIEAIVTEELGAVSFEDLVSKVDDQSRAQMIERLNAQFDIRVAFEKAKNGFNEKIQDTIKKERAKMCRPGLAAILLAAEVNESFINREMQTGKRFNVYAYGKLNDVIYGLSSGHFHNAINGAIIRSMIKCRNAGVPFNGLLAQAAASDKVKIDKALETNMVRHTVSAATAPTQTSSTMNALEVLGIVKNAGTEKFPIYNLTDAPITKRLEALISA